MIAAASGVAAAADAGAPLAPPPVDGAGDAVVPQAATRIKVIPMPRPDRGRCIRPPPHVLGPEWASWSARWSRPAVATLLGRVSPGAGSSGPAAGPVPHPPG